MTKCANYAPKPHISNNLMCSQWFAIKFWAVINVCQSIQTDLDGRLFNCRMFAKKCRMFVSRLKPPYTCAE